MRTRIFALALLPALLPTLICTAPSLAADATSFDPTKVQITAKATSSIPVGTVVTWPSGANPDMQNPDGTYNWLECNGQSISQTVYPELFAVIGAKVPDYRGLFLRGQGGNSEALGTVQNYAMPETYGKGWFVGGLVGTGGVQSMGDGKTFSVKNTWCCYGGGGSSWPGATFEFNVAGDTPVANELRPINTAVRYFIRARP